MTSHVAVVGAARRRARPEAASRLRDRERLAVGLAAAATTLLPLLTPAGPGGTAPVDAVIASALLAGLVWLAAGRRVIRLPCALPVGLLLLGGALGAISGPVPAAGVVALVQDVALVLWFWVIINIATSPERLRVILRAWAYAAVGWALMLLVSVAAGLTFISGQTAAEGARTALTFGNPNFAGSYFFISIMVVWATGRPQHRAARLASYALLLAALLSTGSNGALIAAVVGTTVAGVMGVYRRAGFVPATTALAGVVVAGAVLASQVSLADVQSRASESSYAFVRDGVGRSAKTASDRGLLFRQGIELYQTGGLLGTGPASTKVRLTDENAQRAAEAHNDYLAALTERGVIGLLGLLLLATALGFHALSLATSASKSIARVIVKPAALAGAVAGTLVAMTTTEYLHVRHVWALFGVVVAAALMARE